MQVFQDFGSRLETVWRERNYDESIFPALAAQFLTESNLPSKVSAWEIAEWTLAQTILPEQRDLRGSFGDPPITVYNSPRFHIDAYFWLHSTTAIHQHNFCGAFQVLTGGSLHSHFRFEQRERINFHCAVGDLKVEEVDWLQVGDVREILAGNDFIHSLFHLENPSVTIVVRTYRASLAAPQFSYYKPSIALDPFFEDPQFIKKSQTMAMLLQTDYPETDSIIAEQLRNADFHTSVEMLRLLKRNISNNQLNKMFGNQTGQDRFAPFVEIVREKHGEKAKEIAAMFDELARQQKIIDLRFFIEDGDLRFFLALMLNVEGKNRILSLLQKRKPEQDSTETFLDLTENLSRTRIVGKDTNPLGIPDFNDDYVYVLEGVLNDKTIDEIKTEVHQQYPQGYADELSGKVENYYETLKHSAVFSPLWRS